MKPLFLEISAFGAFGGVERIDFTGLSSGVFLVCGETGAGKTTLFDAISYALYGEMSGSIRETKCVRSDFADESTPTYVHLKFLYKGKEYEIRRNPSFERRKLKGDGVTTEKARVWLRLPDGSVLTEERPVKAKIIDLLGLSHSQWKQVAMIAQGEFTKCLHTESGERSAIFRSIFSTDVYRQLSARLKNEERDAGKKYEAAISSVFQYIDSIMWDSENSLADELFSASESRTVDGASRAADILKRLVESDAERHSALLSECASAQRMLDEKNAAIENARIVNENILELKNVEETRARLIEKEPEISGVEGFIIKAESALCEINEIGEQLKRLAAADNLKEEINKLTQQLSLIQASILQTEGEKAAVLQAQKESHQIIQEHKDVPVALTEQLNRLEKTGDTISALKAIMSDIERYNRLRDGYKSARLVHDKNECTYKRREREFAEKRGFFLKGYAGIMAERLEDGSPCFVCGSKEHPSKAVKIDGIPTEDELMAAEKAVADALAAWQASVVQLSAKQTEGIMLKNVIIESAGKYIEVPAGNAIPEIIRGIDDRIREFERERSTLKKDVRGLEIRRKLLLEAEKKQTEHALRLESLAEREKARESEANGLRTALAQKNGELSEMNKTHEHTTRDEALRRMTDIAGGLELPRSDTRHDFAATVKEAIEKAKGRVNEHRDALIRMNAKIETLTKLIGGRPPNDLAQMGEQAAKLREIKAKLDSEAAGRLSRVNSNAALLERILRGVELIREAEERYSAIERLSKTANGELKGKNKITLEAYVQRSYFYKILSAANIRLKKMTGGRFELFRKRAAANLSDKSFALDLDVLDNITGKIRDISTLSGGESFMAALALALALSDTIQSEAGGVEIQTMFIDEGFGSLSPEYLSLVVGTLTALSGGGCDNGKLIGVISHVDALKDNIDRQILVTKTGFGGSRTEMI